MKNNKKNAYKGYKKAHIYTMIGSIALGLCLIIATIIVVCFFNVEVKVETPTTVIAQTTTDATNNTTTDATNNTTTNANTDADTATNTDTNATVNTKENKPVEEETNTSAPTEDIVEISTENPVEESTENKYSTLTITVNIYTNICKTKFVEITMPVGTILTLAQMKELVLDEFPTFNYARTVGVPASYTFTEEDNGLPGIIKISTITVETPEEDNTIIPEPTEAESEELAEPEAEATEAANDNQEITPAETEEPAQAPTEVVEEPEVTEEPAEETLVKEISIDANKTSILTITVNIYTNICKTVFVNIERPVGTTMSRQDIKDYILSLYTGFDRVRSTGTPDSYTFVEEDGQLPGVIKID